MKRCMVIYETFHETLVSHSVFVSFGHFCKFCEDDQISQRYNSCEWMAQPPSLSLYHVLVGEIGMDQSISVRLLFEMDSNVDHIWIL